jgi:hypothetical protein
MAGRFYCTFVSGQPSIMASRAICKQAVQGTLAKEFLDQCKTADHAAVVP